jgi:hypothetical protein
MAKYNWVCKYCNMPQVATDSNTYSNQCLIKVGFNKHGNIGFKIQATACQNQDCREVDLRFQYIEIDEYFSAHVASEKTLRVKQIIQEYQLRPESTAKPQPDYIPKPILADYYEACRIVDLSPKASATLSRRCLQGMIRDFCKISKPTLNQEITALSDLLEKGQAPSGVTQEMIDAIDHVRQIGNIGAHMEKDINLILDIEPDEAQTLIALIEMLFDDWYKAREQRNNRLSRLKEITEEKSQKKLASPDTSA